MLNSYNQTPAHQFIYSHVRCGFFKPNKIRHQVTHTISFLRHKKEMNTNEIRSSAFGWLQVNDRKNEPSYDVSV